MTRVWVVVVGNYHPPEVVGIYDNEKAAQEHADQGGADLWVDAWIVDSHYVTGLDQ